MTLAGVSGRMKRFMLNQQMANFDPNNPGSVTQDKLNKMFRDSDPPLDLPKRYSTVLKIFLIGLNFMALVPLLCPVILMALCLAYGVDKYALLYNCTRPYTQSVLMPKQAVNLLM